MYEEFPGSHLFAKRQPEKTDFALQGLCLGKPVAGKQPGEQTLRLCSNTIFSCPVCQAFVSVSVKLTSNKRSSVGSSNACLLQTLRSLFFSGKKKEDWLWCLFHFPNEER